MRVNFVSNYFGGLSGFIDLAKNFYYYICGCLNRNEPLAHVFECLAIGNGTIRKRGPNGGSISLWRWT